MRDGVFEDKKMQVIMLWVLVIVLEVSSVIPHRILEGRSSCYSVAYDLMVE